MEKVFRQIIGTALVMGIFFVFGSGDICAQTAVHPEEKNMEPENDYISMIETAYRDIDDLKGQFTQKSYLKDLNRVDTYKGVFFIRRPDKVRWEFKGEKPQEIIINKEEMIIYNINDRQVFKGRFNKHTYGQAPIALLSGFGDVKKEFSIKEKNGRLIMVPIEAMGNIASIELDISKDEKFPIKRFTIHDIHSNKIEIILKDIELNKGTRDSIFNFYVPKGVNVYEYNP